MAGDWFGLETPLQDKVKEATGVRVLSLSDLGEVRDRMQAAPAVFVGYAGDSLADEVTGVHQLWEQQWWTVIAVRSAEQARPGIAQRAAAGPLLAALIDALGGWTPNRGLCAPLRRVGGPDPIYYIGYAEFALRWSTKITNRSLK